MGLFAATVSQAQPLVRTLDVSERACTRDGWCTEFPWPLDVSVADGDGRRTVAGSTGGVLVLHEGTWRAGVDSGLGSVTHVEVKPDRFLACDASRCLEVALGEGGFGPVLSRESPRPKAPPVIEGVFGEEGRYTLKNGRLQVFVRGQRVLSRRATDALGAPGSPLWILDRSDVSRYAPGATAPEKIPVSCSPGCWGGHGRLFGDARAPTLQAPLLLGQALYAFEAGRFAPLHGHGFFIKESTWVLVGGGCAPCVLGARELAIRRPDRWDFIPAPEGRKPARPASVSPSDIWVPSRTPYAVGLGEGGWPTLVFDFPYEQAPLPRQTWSFDGTRWREGAGATTVRVARRGPGTNGTPSAWERLSDSGAGCSVRTPWGERWTIRDSTLSLQGPGGRRVERLPQRVLQCEVFSGEQGIFVFEGKGMLFKRWERLPWGTGTGPGTFRVVGVERGDVLHVRRGPDPVAGIVTGLAPDACVEGTGARTPGTGGTWLKVRDGKGAEGWANARYLRAGPCTP